MSRNPTTAYVIVKIRNALKLKSVWLHSAHSFCFWAQILNFSNYIIVIKCWTMDDITLLQPSSDEIQCRTCTKPCQHSTIFFLFKDAETIQMFTNCTNLEVGRLTEKRINFHPFKTIIYFFNRIYSYCKQTDSLNIFASRATTNYVHSIRFASNVLHQTYFFDKM